MVDASFILNDASLFDLVKDGVTTLTSLVRNLAPKGFKVDDVKAAVRNAVWTGALVLDGERVRVGALRSFDDRSASIHALLAKLHADRRASLA